MKNELSLYRGLFFTAAFLLYLYQKKSWGKSIELGVYNFSAQRLIEKKLSYKKDRDMTRVQ